MTTDHPSFSTNTDEPRRFGRGWISGVFSVLLAGIGLLAVLCLLWPSLLTVKELRAVYGEHLAAVRVAIHFLLIAGFVLGVMSIVLRHNKVLGSIGLLCVLVAALLGGSRAPIHSTVSSPAYLGLDWFILNLVFYSIVFVPIERLFPKRPEQGIFRRNFRVDMTYFFVTTLLVQVVTLLTLRPSALLFGWAVSPAVQAWVKALPWLVQFVAILFFADLFQYWVHRAFHSRWLWKFHAVHHSADQMDWLAGSRIHLADAVITRGLSYVPIFVLGFHQVPLYAYIGFVSIQAVFIHANVNFKFGPLRWIFSTPQYHHWHHAAEVEAIDKNFAVHLPLWDLLFGTFYLPGERWPSAYGVVGSTVPETYVGQMVYPFVPERGGEEVKNE